MEVTVDGRNGDYYARCISGLLEPRLESGPLG
jgi:hypothetical protein